MQNTQQPAMGQVLFFNEADYKELYPKALKIILPPTVDMINSYNALGLTEPFTTEILHQYLDQGPRETRKMLEETTRQDMSHFRSPVAMKHAMQEVDNLMVPLEQAVKNVKQAIQTFGSETGYTVSTVELSVRNGKVVFDSGIMQEHFTHRIETELQLEAYNRLQALGLLYNETVAFLRNARKKDSPVGIFNNYFTRTQVGSFSVSEEVELNPKAIAFIK